MAAGAVAVNHRGEVIQYTYGAYHFGSFMNSRPPRTPQRRAPQALPPSQSRGSPGGFAHQIRSHGSRGFAAAGIGANAIFALSSSLRFRGTERSEERRVGK